MSVQFLHRIKKSIHRVVLILAALSMLPITTTANETNPMIKLTTSMGEITIEMYPNEAPATVQNFLNYVESGFFDGLIFHRVIEGFMIQGGGFAPDMQQKKSGEPIQNEADNGLKNETGTLAMARTGDPHSATAQFFINLENNDFLNHTGKNPQGWGYAVFGKVTEGLDVVDKIGSVSTYTAGAYSDVPVEPVIIENVQVIAQ